MGQEQVGHGGGGAAGGGEGDGGGGEGGSAGGGRGGSEGGNEQSPFEISSGLLVSCAGTKGGASAPKTQISGSVPGVGGARNIPGPPPEEAVFE